MMQHSTTILETQEGGRRQLTQDGCSKALRDGLTVKTPPSTAQSDVRKWEKEGLASRLKHAMCVWKIEEHFGGSSRKENSEGRRAAQTH